MLCSPSFCQGQSYPFGSNAFMEKVLPLHTIEFRLIDDTNSQQFSGEHRLGGGHSGDKRLLMLQQVCGDWPAWGMTRASSCSCNNHNCSYDCVIVLLSLGKFLYCLLLFFRLQLTNLASGPSRFALYLKSRACVCCPVESLIPDSAETLKFSSIWDIEING